MNKDDLESLDLEITRAHSLANEQKFELAVRSFDLARAMCHLLADQEGLTKIINHEVSKLTEEREKFAGIVSAANTNAQDPSLLILGDSLGLPRPNMMNTEHRGAEATYGWALSQGQNSFRVTQKCQRYYTTHDAINMLQKDPSLNVTDTALIHLGLNDCANRMFLVRDRHSLTLLSEELRQKIVTFSQKHRAQILKLLPSRHYITEADYSKNLNILIHLLKTGGAKKIALATTILPPKRFRPGTPGVNQNFATYNLALMKVAHNNDVDVFDMDRLVYDHGGQDMLDQDGMHLSAEGHQLFAEEASKLLAL